MWISCPFILSLWWPNPSYWLYLLYDFSMHTEKNWFFNIWMNAFVPITQFLIARVTCRHRLAAADRITVVYHFLSEGNWVWEAMIDVYMQKYETGSLTNKRPCFPLLFGLGCTPSWSACESPYVTWTVKWIIPSRWLQLRATVQMFPHLTPSKRLCLHVLWECQRVWWCTVASTTHECRPRVCVFIC